MRKLIAHLFFIAIICSIFVACKKGESVDVDTRPEFVYPQNKIWAHQVIDTLVAQQKSAFFDGLEIDLLYCAAKNQLFVGHEITDTARQLTFDLWLSALPAPQKHWFWIDMKNLDLENASAIAHLLLKSANEYNIKSRLMVEHKSSMPLRILKDSGLYVMLWVDNIYYSHLSVEEWYLSVQQEINNLHPDALSCDYRNYPLLTQSFPTHNIHFWHTPAEYTPENVELTRKIAQEPSVKIVLVDYERPISY